MKRFINNHKQRMQPKADTEHKKRHSKWFRCGKDIIKNTFEIEYGSSLRGLTTISLQILVVSWFKLSAEQVQKKELS